MIEVDVEKDSTEFRIYSTTHELDDIFVSFVHAANKMAIKQFEDTEDEDCQYIELTPQMAFALYGIMRSMFGDKTLDANGRISKGS